MLKDFDKFQRSLKSWTDSEFVKKGLDSDPFYFSGRYVSIRATPTENETGFYLPTLLMIKEGIDQFTECFMLGTPSDLLALGKTLEWAGKF